MSQATSRTSTAGEEFNLLLEESSNGTSGLASDAASIIKDDDNDMAAVIDDTRSYCDETDESEIHSENISLKVASAAELTIPTLEEASKLLEVIAKSPNVSHSSLSGNLADDAPGLIE